MYGSLAGRSDRTRYSCNDRPDHSELFSSLSLLILCLIDREDCVALLSPTTVLMVIMNSPSSVSVDREWATKGNVGVAGGTIFADAPQWRFKMR